MVFTVVVVAQAQTTFLNNAQSGNTVEPESGTVSGKVTVVNNANAAGGQYVVLGSAPVSTPTPTSTTTPAEGAVFDDEFDSLSLHRKWQPGDKWQLIAPDSPDGRGGPTGGEGGSMYWVNPYNPSTPVNGVYSNSNGQLVLGLLNTPSNIQSAIDNLAGTHLPYVGALLNNYPVNYQHYGYWNFGMSCDKVPGFSCEISMENVQITGHWPPQINLGVSTDAFGNQTVQAAVHDGGTHDFNQPIDGTQMHDYGVNWQRDYITFYVDGVQIYQIPNPGGVYQSDNQFVFIYTGANYSKGTGVNPLPSSLSAFARFDYFRIYPNKPSSTVRSISPTATPSITR